MPAYHFPILISEGHDGHILAVLIEDAGRTAAVDQRAGDAIGQIKDLLEWRLKSERGLSKPSLIDARCSMIKVDVRAEYPDEKEKSFAVQESIALRIPCVRCTDDAGLLMCVLPTLGVRFSYYDAEGFKGLVTYTVQTELKGHTPEELAQLLPPRHVYIDDIVVHAPRTQQKGKNPKRTLRALSVAADPLGSRELRRNILRPWERDREVAATVQVLQKEKSSLLMLGEAGVGKTAILAEAVRKAEREGLPETDGVNETDENSDLPRFWLTSASRLIAGMKYLGQWQGRVEAIIAELAEISGALCVESLLDLVQIGGTGPVDSIAAFLVPYMQRRELRLVAEATPAELDACRRLLPSFADLFQVLTVEKMSRSQAINALGYIAEQQSRNLRIECDRTIAEIIYRLFSRFMPYRGFPGPAAGFVGEVFEAATRSKASKIGRELVIDRFIQRTGLPELFLRDDLLLDEAKVAAKLKARVIGQTAACNTAAGIITTFKAGMNDPARPISVMLFCGPTGVGKTELARAIADFMFGHGENRDRMVRLDMSEYSSPGSAARFMTDSTGGPSALLKRIRQQPFNVVLLDEIEKAAPEVFDVLLGVFDEGRLTDRLGRTTIFRSTIIVMTSNLGADRSEPFGLSRTSTHTHESAAASFFRPEFVNRIDLLVNFQPLDAASIRMICTKELAEIQQREGLAKNNLKLAWTDALVEHLARTGFDRRYGARPLQRTLETLIVIPLSRELLARPTLLDTTIRIDIDRDGNVSFESTA